MKLKLAVTGKRKLWFIISALIILPGLLSLLIQGLNLGIDFTGGSLIQLQFDEEVEVAEVRDVISIFDLEHSSIQSAAENNIFIRSSGLEETDRREIMDELEQSIGTFSIMRIEKVGATISGELRNEAFLAMLLATLLMIAYITFRFEFKFAIAGIGALMHDVLVVVGIFSLLQIEIDSSFVVGLLTIVGYSINDTIVSFDRIRENMKGYRKGSVATIVDDSINQVLRRSIYTSLTTLVAVASLLFLGGDTTRVFALALFIGIISGTYSSIFTASNLWTMWRDYDDNKSRTASSGHIVNTN